MQDFRLVALEGNIGVGKSTLAVKLVAELNKQTKPDDKKWSLIIEDVDTNPEFKRLLGEFTKDPNNRIAFQKFVTEHRASVCANLDPNYNYVIERSLYSDLVFCQANLQEAPRPDGKDLTYYYDIWNKLETYPKITELVYLKSSPEIAYERMLDRSRAEEDGTPMNYIELLSGCHDVFLPQICRKMGTDMLVLDWNKFGEAEDVAKSILNKD